MQWQFEFVSSSAIEAEQFPEPISDLTKGKIISTIKVFVEYILCDTSKILSVYN